MASYDAASSIWQTLDHGVDFLSMCLESKEADGGRTSGPNGERSCWLLFRMSSVNELESRASVHRDSYGRFAADGAGGDNTSLGWNDYMPMADFSAQDDG